MYRLKNPYGNELKETDSKQKRDALLRDGYVEITEEPKAPKAPKEKAPKAPKENKAENASGDAE